MCKLEGRADRPSLFVSCAGLSLLAASLFTDRWYQWLGVGLLALAWAPRCAYPANLLGVLVGAYCTWLLGNAVFVTPVYSAESLYQPLMLFGGFVAVAALDPDKQSGLFRAGALLVAGLVLLALLQYFLGFWHLEHNPTRAAATFMTPNTLATAINLFLAPVAALFLVQGARGLLLLSFWLFAGVVASESRGGMLALMMGLAFIAFAMGPEAIRQGAKRWLVLLGGWALVWILVAVPLSAIREAAGLAGAAAPWLDRVTWDRADIYAATLRLVLAQPVAGAGANMFFPLFEMVKPDSMRDGDYYYAHSDYLQVWLEFGATGLALLVSVAAAALFPALRSCRRFPQRIPPLTCGAALTTSFAHAVVDFPLYVPFILLVVGAYLGALARQSGGPLIPESARHSLTKAFTSVTPAIRWTLVLAALAWLAQPMIAELAVLRGIVVLARGEASDGLYWQSVARRLEPRHPAHYWAEATIWREQAILTRNRDFAERADTLLVEGMRANPYDVAVRIARIQLHRRHPDLLKSPAPPSEVLAWAREAVTLRPQHVIVQGELVRALAYAGKPEEARLLAQSLVRKYPELRFARRLAAEL